MADEPQVPAQPEGASQPTKKKPVPVNLAMVEAAERGINLDVPAAKEAERESTPGKGATPSTKSAEPSEQAKVEEVAASSLQGTADPVEESRSEHPDDPGISAEGVPIEEGSAVEALGKMAESGSQKRLAPREEDQATALLRKCISTGEAAAALEAMPKLPWILGVRAIEQAWPQLSAEGRTELLQKLAALDSEHAIRLRLSVARSLAKLDPPTGTQLAGAVCSRMWDSEKGALSSEHSKLIGNVFIGRGKPWILQLPLENLEPSDADAIASAVVFSAFNVNNPPITQLSLLRYAAPRLSGLHANLLAMVGKGVSRWSGKWQDSLRKEIPDLPDSITEALKSGRSGKAERKPGATPSVDESIPPESLEDETDLPLPPALEEKLKLAVESGDADAVAAATLEANAWRDAQSRRTEEASAGDNVEAAEEPAPDQERRGDKRGRRGRDRERGDKSERKERPVYVSREQEAASKGGAFNLNAALKQIENHVAQLRNELSSTQAKLRKAETGGVRRSSDKVLLSVEEANLSTDELKRLIVQLEQRNAELQTRVEELLADSETRALATAADADVTVQFRTLLKYKLQEDYSDYLALEKNLPEYVVQQHYRALIRHVFGVLREEGIALLGDLPPPPPDPLPPPPPPPVIEDDDEEEDSPLDKLDEDPEPDAEQAEAEPVVDDIESTENLNGDHDSSMTDASESPENGPREEK